jgi:dynein heavy chain
MVGSKLIDEVTFKQQETLVTRANWFLEEYNNLTKKQMDLVLFDFAIMHCIRILRVIAMARGNCFLVGLGGTGRQSLSKLATFMADFNTFDIEMSKQYSKENWKDDMKRLLLATG